MKPTGIEQKTAQLRIRKRCIIAEGCGGQIFWATPTRARLLIDAGAVDLVNGPTEQPAAGPSETKPAGPTEKKFSGAGPDGPSTASASSNEPGTAPAASSSEADHPSPLNNAEPLATRGRGRGKPRKSGSSR